MQAEIDRVNKLSNECAIMSFALAISNKLFAMAGERNDEKAAAYLEAALVVINEAKEQAE